VKGLAESVAISRSAESESDLVGLSIGLCVFKSLDRDLKLERVLCWNIKVDGNVHEFNGHECNFFAALNGVGHTEPAALFPRPV